MKLFIYIIILFFTIYYIININTEKFKDSSFEACHHNITDIQYLKHMIPHHKVAVDISIELQKLSKWPEMHDILRKLIWTQNYEIYLMKKMLNTLPDDMSDNNISMDTKYQSTTYNFISPNKLGLTNTYCNPHFFDPKEHMKHLKHMKLTDESYINHMIPHHQVAVDMSKKLLKNTKNDFMIYLAYRIIRGQESEVVMLNDLKKSTYKSEILI